jgi:hypothetical protein
MRYTTNGSVRLKRSDENDGASTMYSPELIDTVTVIIDPLMDRYALEDWKAMSPDCRPRSPDRFRTETDYDAGSPPSADEENRDEIGVMCVDGSCSSFERWTTRKDVGVMLTLMKPCLGDFDLQMTIQAPGIPFTPGIPSKSFRKKVLDKANQRMKGMTAYGVLRL